MVKTLLDMSELQTVGRDDKIILDAIVEEVLADLEPVSYTHLDVYKRQAFH